jgi:hypothetical protein
MRRLALVVVLGVATIASAQDPACAPCRDRGVVTCKLCEARVCASDAGFEFCSVALECTDCRGVRLRECTQCERAPEVDLAARTAELEQWRATKQPVEDFMARRDLVFIDSAHFRMVSDLKRSDIKGVTTAHGAAHVLVDRLERLFTAFEQDSGVAPDKWTGVTSVMLWNSERDQERASAKYTLEKTTSMAKLMGKAPVVSLAVGKGALKDDDGLYRALVHQVAHCLLSNAYDGIWIGSQKGGWMDEGVAHAYEQRLFGSVETWCAISEKSVAEAKLGRFEAFVLDALADERVIELSALSGLDTGALNPAQRVFAWSYSDFLLRHKQGKLGAVARVLKQAQPTSEAILTGLGVSMTDFQLEWRTWVQATYSRKRK